MMQEYRYVVVVEAETQEQADQVITNRVYYYEDYGFDYRINVSRRSSIAIVIDRADLPEVKHAQGIDYYTDSAGWKREVESAADYNRRLALHYLALAEYLDAHPPVDPAVVRALALDIGELDEAEGADGLAHRLAAAGWRKEAD